MCDALLTSGAEVIGIDAFTDATDPRLKRWRVEQLTTAWPRFRCMEGDVTESAQVETVRNLAAEIFRNPGWTPEVVIHLAARAGVRESVVSPGLCYRVNVGGTLNLLEFCRRHGTAKFVLASSSSVYGANAIQPQKESHPTDAPCSPYAASKKSAEVTAYSYHALHGLDISVLRFFTVYGPAGRPDMSIFRFIRNITEGDPIIVYGDGTQSRDFSYVGDVVRGIISATQPFGYRTFNLGGDHPVVLNDVITGISRRVGRRPVVDHRPPHPADIPATWADITLARTQLHWEPQIRIDEGLDRCVTWYMEHREMARSLARH
ncbi:MAG: GDP-mannose 4,6-dehydratase [Planctomycetia bacterium]|nr:GDP-mannose 4,6-dehydratase [Planctomycetia bacterium]